jgi:transposase
MPKPYSLDLRERVLKDCDAGMRSEDVAEKYTVSASWVYDLRKKRRETGSIAPKKQRHGQKPKLEPYEKEVRQVVADHPDATLAEFCEMLSKHVSVSTTTLCDFLRHLKITRKKRLSSLSSESGQMSSPDEPNGSNSMPPSTRKNSFSSTKLGRKRT